MQVKKAPIDDTHITVNITVDPPELANLKTHVLQKLAPQVKLQGFRDGHIPLELVEKNLNPATLQNEFVEEAINHLYGDALNHLKVRPIAQPKITLKKFVPFTELEFEAELEVIGDVGLPDYKAMKIKKHKPEVTAEDVRAIVKQLQARMAERKPVDRPAKENDEVVMDFSGIDDKGQLVNGADGRDYPIIIGSNAFIPGFEENLTGLKSGESKTFDVTFPKDYGVKRLQGQKITFTVNIKAVNELTEPKADDEFAAKVGPFTTLKDLKADIKKQITSERQYEADRETENDIMKAIADKTKVVIPEALVEEQVERLWQEIRQNLTYRGQTMPEFLADQSKTEAEYAKDVLRPQAEERVKGGLILSEIAEREQLGVTQQELQDRIAQLKTQYQDPQMQAELDNKANQRDIIARLLTEKTLVFLVANIAE